MSVLLVENYTVLFGAQQAWPGAMDSYLSEEQVATRKQADRDARLRAMQRYMRRASEMPLEEFSKLVATRCETIKTGEDAE